MKTQLITLLILSASLYCHGQEKYTLRGELPDNSLDGEFILLYDNSALIDEHKRTRQALAEADSILVVGREFYHEGMISKAPFLAKIMAKDYSTSLVVEPGDIHLRITDWKYEGRVWGTPVNDDYNTYIIERSNRLKAITGNRDKTYLQTVDEQNFFRSTRENSRDGELIFLKKYAGYPDVIRSKLIRYISPHINESDLAKYLHIVGLMPKTDREILLVWRDYMIKRIEYYDKTRALTDSLKANAPRFIEIDPDSVSSTNSTARKTK